MRTRDLGTDHRRDEDLEPRPVPDLHRKALGIGRIRVEMRDGLLQPRKDVGHQSTLVSARKPFRRSPSRISIPPPHSHEILTLSSLS